MDPKMRQGSRLKALGDIKDLMMDGEAERAKPLFANAPPPEGEALEGADPEAEPMAEEPPSELSPEDVAKLGALLDLMK